MPNAPVAPPAPDLACAIEEGEKARERYLSAIEEDDAFDDLDAVTIAACLKLREALETLLAASRAAMEERDRLREALEESEKETCSLVLLGAHACRDTDNPCPACRARLLRRELYPEALAPAAKEEKPL